MRGQATVEFSLVIGIVLLLILGAVQTGIYAIERNNAMSATEEGVLTAISALGSPSGGPASADAVYAAISGQLRNALFGAHPVQQAPVGNACPALDPTWGVGEVHVCSTYDPSTTRVDISVRGWVPALVPRGFGISNSHSWVLALDLHEVAHVATFAP